MELAQSLQKAIKFLREGNAKDAIEALEYVLHNDEFAQAEDLVDIRARTLSLYAQALLDENRFADSRKAAELAMELVKGLDDTTGEKQIRQLLRDISAKHLGALKMAGHIRRQKSAPQKTIQSLVEQAGTESGLSEMISQAALKLRIGRREDAQKLAEHILTLDGVTEKDRVIALLLLTHTNPSACDEYLEKAWAIADEANDFNLLQAIAKTAEEFNHPIAVIDGPQMNK